VGHAGRITLLGNGTYFFRYVTQNFDGSYTEQVDQGLDTIGGVISRFRGNLTALYQVSNWEVSLTQHYQKRYHDSESSITGVPRFVSAYETADVQLSYTGLKSFRFTLGANNVFDRDPPYANYAASANNFVGGYDLAYGDPRGRFAYRPHPASRSRRKMAAARCRGEQPPYQESISTAGRCAPSTNDHNCRIGWSSPGNRSSCTGNSGRNTPRRAAA
jgi:hypothetical protein